MEGVPSQSLDKEKIARKTRRHIWLQIYLPLALGVIILVGLGIWVVLADFGTASVWGDVSLVLIIFPTFVIGLLIFAALLGITYGLFRLIGILPDPIHRVHETVERVGEVMSQSADLALRPVVTVRKTGAALKVVWKAIVSLL
jgi:cell division protein FtsW (lipid II flippase)